MEILKGSVTKIVNTQRRNPLSYDDDGKPFSSLFRKNRVSFYEDLRTEAVLLLEFEKINEIINSIDYLDTLKEKVHDRNVEKIIEPLEICVPREGIPKASDGEYGDLTYKDKFEALKNKYDDLKKNLDTRIHMELIKAGVFYNKDDIQNVLHMVRKYQGDLKTKKSIINVQNGIIQNVMERNKLSRNKLMVDKKKNEELMKMCRTYYEQNKSAQIRLRKLKHAFLEYKIALESIVSCCEKIGAGVFYNKDDIQNVLHMVRKYQGDLKTKKSIINVQNGIIQNVMERNKLSRNKLMVDKKKNEELMKMCRTYYEQNKSAQIRLRKLKHAFLEYKIALESIVSCCEKIGGDKIILMDVVKSARAQTDLSIATDILNTKKIQELEMNICYCEHQINSLKDDLDAMLGKLQNEKKEKREVMNQTLQYKEYLAKNNAMLIEALENFRRVMISVDEHLAREGDRSNFKETFEKSKKKYNDFVRKAAQKNKDLQQMGDKLLLESALSGRELKKHQEYLNKQISEMIKKKGVVEGGEEKQGEEQKGLKNRGNVGEAEKTNNEEQQDKKQNLEGESSQGAKEIANEKETEQAEQKDEQPTHVDESLEGKKINQVMELLKKKQMNRLSFEDCVDVIYKANIPLTQSKLNELKAMGEVDKEDLVAFIKTFIIDEDEALQNMITFFEIWDVQKTGYMHKELILLILKQFGDRLTEDEMEYLQGEVNAFKDSNISYGGMEQGICKMRHFINAPFINVAGVTIPLEKDHEKKVHPNGSSDEFAKM
ncbi:hypothetical protein AK88_02656 [Plasmodium fragile]|uniref:EF-hand domain-containing protein n=1 Tax=Plasmodium fragile TaxID=5857 RepID=A0A0D9QL16_PLAFR|nr:uncharacterized protein AK88_02656 [Plasmodium fragile]KJP87628.1 hypothetical protein AK88_02656 [Plasmodium fragile]